MNREQRQEERPAEQTSVNVLFPALTRASISSTFVAWILKFQDHAKGKSELPGGVRPLPALQ